MVIFKCLYVCLPVWLSDFPKTHMHARSLTHKTPSRATDTKGWLSYSQGAAALLINLPKFHKVVSFFKELEHLSVTYCKVILCWTDISRTLFVLINSRYCGGFVPVSVMLKLSRKSQKSCTGVWLGEEISFTFNRQHLPLLYTNPPAC